LLGIFGEDTEAKPKYNPEPLDFARDGSRDGEHIES
jgi:hypothetical protein